MKPVTSFLPAFVREAAKDESAAFLCLCEFWPRIVGEDLARKTFPLRLIRKELVLEVAGESWRSELAEIRSMLIHSINAFWRRELVERITFTVRPSN
ncbi:MAG: DUF721 domain-containing protein [Acidobacteria bacterium]|nr:MAG: DUF721 domain-containing protein [Acidobacteriota bacterium]